MGSAKILNIRFLRKWSCLLALLFLSSVYASAMDDMLKINDADAIIVWAKKTYLGGYERHQFTRDDKYVVVIVGMRTSGLATSEIAIFDKTPGGAFKLMLWRSSIYGFVSVKEAGDEIVFSAKTKVIVIPWSGVVLDMEQMNDRRR